MILSAFENRLRATLV